MKWTPELIRQEIIRKARAGIPLDDPTPEKKRIYDEYRQTTTDRNRSTGSGSGSTPNDLLFNPLKNVNETYFAIGFIILLIGIFKR